jgi:hypothetical protein
LKERARDNRGPNGKHKATYAAFVDVKKAFPSVFKDGLWWRLNEAGITGRAWGMIRQLYSDTWSRLQAPGVGMEDYYEILTGLREGSALAPLLFLVYINPLIKELEAKDQGIHHLGQYLGLLLYADDIVMMAESPEDLQKMIDTLQEFAARWRFEVNKSKTQVMVIRERESERRVRLEKPEGNTWLYNGEPLKVVKEYKYLGVWITDDLKWSYHTRKTLIKLHGAAKAAMTIGAKYGGFPYYTAAEIYRALAESKVTYGIEMWGTRKALDDIKRILHRVPTKLVGVTGEPTEQVILAEMGMDSLDTVMAKKTLWLLHHLASMPEDSFANRQHRKNMETAIPSTANATLGCFENRALAYLELYDLTNYRDRLQNMTAEEWKELVDEASLIRRTAEYHRVMRMTNTQQRIIQHFILLAQEIAAFDGPAAYLRLEPQIDNVQLLMECRMQCFKIRAHRGRAIGDKQYYERVCWACPQHVEDNAHFLLDCPHYVSQREKMLTDIDKLATETYQNMRDNGDTRPHLQIREEMRAHNQARADNIPTVRLEHLLLAVPPGVRWNIPEEMWRKMLGIVTTYLAAAIKERRKHTKNTYQYW